MCAVYADAVKNEMSLCVIVGICKFTNAREQYIEPRRFPTELEKGRPGFEEQGRFVQDTRKEYNLRFQMPHTPQRHSIKVALEGLRTPLTRVQFY